MRIIHKYRTTKILQLSLAILFSVATAACIPDNDSIAPGTYQSNSSAEWILVTSDEIEFHVNFYVDRPDSITEKKTTYHLEAKGRIKFPMTSAEFFEGQSWYKWYWRDGKIAKVDLDTKETTWFIRRDEP